MSKEEWSIEEITSTFNKVASIDKDSINAIDGPAGVGKSVLAIKLCKKGCPWFDMEKDILYSRKDIMSWISSARPGSHGIADEIINALFKRDFQKGDQKFLLKLLDMCRNRNLTLYFLLPNFWALDKHILDGRIRVRFHVAKTGLAFLWKPSGNPFTSDKWCKNYNEKVCTNWDSYPNARRTKGFLGYLKFGDLGSEEKKKYVLIKERKKAEVLASEEEEEKKEDINNKRSVELGKLIMIDFFSRKGLLKLGWLKILSDAEGVTHQAIAERLKRFNEDNLPPIKEGKWGKDNNIYNSKGNTDNIDINQAEIIP